jgi:hypothetical protein
MKPVSKKITLFSVLSFCVLLACTKNVHHDGTGTSSTSLSLSGSSVKRGEPLVATAPAGISSAIKWSVSPSSLAHVTTGSGQAMFLFAGSGTYHVTASYPSADGKSTDSATSPITVSEETYTGPTNYGDTVDLAGDQVSLTPISDPTHGLVLLAQSTKKYNCLPTFIGWSLAGPDLSTGISLKFWKVAEGDIYGKGDCNGGTNQAASYLFFAQPQPFANGAYPFSVTLNNVTYQGTLTVTDQSFAFSWSYDSGVTISPKQISR